MTTTPNTLPEIRKSYLASLNQAESETDWLRGILAELEKSQPVLFDSDIDESLEEISPDKTRWTPEYFSRQKKQAEQSFSRERVNHLLDVREYFRQRGDKGFVPKALPSVTPDKQEDISGYTPSKHLKKFVEEGNLFTIRGALRGDMINTRLESHTLRQALAWTKACVPGLCEPYVEKAFSREMDQDRSHWDTEYFFSQECYLEANFSEKRYQHMVDVREHLRQQGVEGFATVSSPAPKTSSGPAFTSTRSSSSQGERTDTSSTDPEQPSFFRNALLIGGAIAALVVFLLSL
jgi:hypothetical protein